MLFLLNLFLEHTPAVCNSCGECVPGDSEELLDAGRASGHVQKGAQHLPVHGHADPDGIKYVVRMTVVSYRHIEFSLISRLGVMVPI